MYQITNASQPSCLLLVSSTLEVASLLKASYPNFEGQLTCLENEVKQVGQRLLECHSFSQAHHELKRILQVRSTLEAMKEEADLLKERNL